jgi:hypothetical protein
MAVVKEELRSQQVPMSESITKRNCFSETASTPFLQSDFYLQFMSN